MREVGMGVDVGCGVGDGQCWRNKVQVGWKVDLSDTTSKKGMR